jgi:hypothetical protein
MADGDFIEIISKENIEKLEDWGNRAIDREFKEILSER